MKCRVMKSLHGRACAPACRNMFTPIDRNSQEKMNLSQIFLWEGEKTKVIGVRRGEERAKKGHGQRGVCGVGAEDRGGILRRSGQMYDRQAGGIKKTDGRQG